VFTGRVAILVTQIRECRLKKAANGRGETVLREEHHWTDRAYGAGTIDKIPDDWTFAKKRIEELFDIT
jgi:hypothetical protein